MDCPKCGGNMENGCAAFEARTGLLRLRDTFTAWNHPYLAWFSKKSVKKYSKFPQSLLIKPDLKIHSKRYEMGYYGYKAYRCKNCGAILIIPSEDDEK